MSTSNTETAAIEEISLHEGEAPPAALEMEWEALQVLDEETEASLLRRWSPVLHLHPAERFVPTCVDHYLANSTLGSKASPEEEPVQATWEGVVQKGRDALITPRQEYLADPASHPPCVHGCARRRPQDGRVVLAFLMFYADQPDVSVCCHWRAGGHICDLEWLIFVLSPDGQTLEWAYFTAHGRTESSWVPGASLQWKVVRKEGEAEGEGAARPVAYVAKTTHALTWSAGWKPRLWFAVIEKTSAAGRVIDAAEVLSIVKPDHPWWQFPGSMGPDGCGSIGGKGRLNTPAFAGSEWTTAWRRSLFRTS